MKRKVIQVYTDGAASGNPGPAGWACTLDGQMISDCFEHGATNNVMETFAVLKAVEFAPANAHLVIHTDSKLCIGWFSQCWKRNNPVIDGIVEGYFVHCEEKNLYVEFVKVKGHANDQGNNIVDAEARRQSLIARYNSRPSLFPSQT